MKSAQWGIHKVSPKCIIHLKKNLEYIFKNSYVYILTIWCQRFKFVLSVACQCVHYNMFSSPKKNYFLYPLLTQEKLHAVDP